MGRQEPARDIIKTLEGTVTNMEDKPREFIYVEPEDYIPKDIYDMYFKDDEEDDQTEEQLDEQLAEDED